MEQTRNKRPIGAWNEVEINPGESRDVHLVCGESYSGMTQRIPLHVRRGEKDGPVVFVTAALHGDEINGTGAIRSLIKDANLRLKSGALILVPVLNLLSFERHSRYLPDRRDLNRCFPGSLRGSQASRLARVIFDEIVSRGDYGIDLHTAAVRRTNFPNIRADLSSPKVRQLAEWFGAEVIVNGKGPKGALRREACVRGCPTIVFEGGEVWKVESSIVDWARRGILNVLIRLNMLEGTPKRPKSQLMIEKTRWVRADRGGFLTFHVGPGDIVEENQPLATNASLMGHERNVLTAPFPGVLLGMTTLPAVSPGEPVCHLGHLPSTPKRLERVRQKMASDDLHERVVDDLATSIHVVEPTDE